MIQRESKGGTVTTNRTTSRLSTVMGIPDGSVFDLSQPLFQGMPCSPNQPGFRMALTRRHGDYRRSDGTSGSSEMIITGGHVGTHMDALCHASADGLMHGGVVAEEAQRGGRFSELGIDTVPPLIGKGILFDLPGAMDLDHLPAAFGIGVDELVATARHFSLALDEVDFALIRTGWARLFDDAEAYVGTESGVPGLSPDGAEWLSELGIVATGSDTIAYERMEPGSGNRLMPVHRILLVERGIHIVELMNLEEVASEGVHEFGLILAPLRIIGGTGAPVRPVAWTMGSNGQE